MRLTGYAAIGGLTALLVAAVFEARGVSGLTYPLLLWVAVIAVLVGQLRSYVKLGEWKLTVQKPMRRYEIALLEIEEVRDVAGGTARWIRTREGLLVKASAIVATRVSRGQAARVELAAEAIRAAIGRASETFRQ